MDGEGKLRWKGLSQQSASISFNESLYFFPEAYIKLLISSSKTLEKEKKEDVEKILSQTLQSYLKFNDHSRDNHAQALKSLTDHLIKIYELILVTVCAGSIIIIVECPTLESLEHLWKDYIAGHLDKVAERYLVTEEMRIELNLETVCLTTAIEEENYLNCQNALFDLGEYKQNVWKTISFM